MRRAWMARRIPQCSFCIPESETSSSDFVDRCIVSRGARTLLKETPSGAGIWDAASVRAVADRGHRRSCPPPRRGPLIQTPFQSSEAFDRSRVQFLCLARAFRRGFTRRLSVVLGILIAVGFLTKLNFVGVAFGVYVGLVVLEARADRRGALGSLAIAGGHRRGAGAALRAYQRALSPFHIRDRLGDRRCAFAEAAVQRDQLHMADVPAAPAGNAALLPRDSPVPRSVVRPFRRSLRLDGNHVPGLGRQRRAGDCDSTLPLCRLRLSSRSFFPDLLSL
jgi:hypothetical protein